MDALREKLRDGSATVADLIVAMEAIPSLGAVVTLLRTLDTKAKVREVNHNDFWVSIYDDGVGTQIGISIYWY